MGLKPSDVALELHETQYHLFRRAVVLRRADKDRSGGTWSAFRCFTKEGSTMGSYF